jgi:hypothetical protein
VLAFEERREEISPIPRLVAQGRHTAPTPLSPTIREITLGETINADIAVAGPPCTTTHGWPVPCHCYAFTPSADGTVTATLTWDALKTDTILLLRIENTQLEASVSPIVGELSVRAGQRYTLQVGMAGTGDFGPKPYVLTMAVQRSVAERRVIASSAASAPRLRRAPVARARPVIAISPSNQRGPSSETRSASTSNCSVILNRPS